MIEDTEYPQTTSGADKLGNVSEKNLEAKARRLAKTKGLELIKSRSRNPNAYEFGGYVLADIAGNFAVAGAYPMAFSLTLEQVLEELEQR